MSDTFVYDSGALIAIADGQNQRSAEKHRERLTIGNRVFVPAVVAAQVVRNPASQARLMRTLRGCDIVPFTADDHVPVGRLLAASGTSDVVDAFVALLAVQNSSAVVTGDFSDIRHLLGCLGSRRPVVRV